VKLQSARHVEGMECGWTYERERLSVHCYARYCRRMLGVRAAPRFSVLKAVGPRPRWILYFIYAPAGRLNAHHYFTLRRLKEHGIGLLVVLASPSPDDIPSILHDCVDAIYWKELNGFDFSAYSIGLRAVAHYSPGSRVLVMNDSVFGPFTDLTPYIDEAPWDLTGFTATDVSEQRHIQSYAFIMKDVTDARLDKLKYVLPSRVAFNSGYGVISCQELWFARAASRSMSVGAFWWGAETNVLDPTLVKAIELIDAGFPFLKQSLLTRQSRFHPPGVIQQLVERLETTQARTEISR
jgi:hypothetical protein